MSYYPLFMGLCLITLFFSCKEQSSKIAQHKYEQSTPCNDGFENILKEYDYSDLNTEWLEEDFEFFAKLQNLCLNNPENITSLVIFKDGDVIPMGNDYYVRKGSLGKGYLTFYYTSVYMRDSLLAYELSISPEDYLLLDRLKKNPELVFKKHKDIRLNQMEYIYYHGYERVSDSLQELNLDHKNKEVFRYYMTPFSGVQYGCRGGYGNFILKNRCIFKQITNTRDLSKKELTTLLNSINLASRLTAIEYYTRNIDQYDQIDQKEIESKITMFFKNNKKLKLSYLMTDIGISLSVEDAVNLELEKTCF